MLAASTVIFRISIKKHLHDPFFLRKLVMLTLGLTLLVSSGGNLELKKVEYDCDCPRLLSNVDIEA